MDRCNKLIEPEPKCYLFELKFNDKDKTEIFGAKDNQERMVILERTSIF
jgi:hypothetical protein